MAARSHAGQAEQAWLGCRKGRPPKRGGSGRAGHSWPRDAKIAWPLEVEEAEAAQAVDVEATLCGGAAPKRARVARGRVATEAQAEGASRKLEIEEAVGCS